MVTHTFKPGDRVRCVELDRQNMLLVGETYTIDRIEGDFVHIRELGGYGAFPRRFEPIAPPYSIPAQCQEAPAACDKCGKPADLRCGWCFDCAEAHWGGDDKVTVTETVEVEPTPWGYIVGRTVRWQTPPDNCIPESARRILDLGRTQQPAPVPQQPVDERAAGVARAVANLNDHEKRLGASRFQP